MHPKILAVEIRKICSSNRQIELLAIGNSSRSFSTSKMVNRRSLFKSCYPHPTKVSSASIVGSRWAAGRNSNESCSNLLKINLSSYLVSSQIWATWPQARPSLKAASFLRNRSNAVHQWKYLRHEGSNSFKKASLPASPPFTIRTTLVSRVSHLRSQKCTDSILTRTIWKSSQNERRRMSSASAHDKHPRKSNRSRSNCSCCNHRVHR